MVYRNPLVQPPMDVVLDYNYIRRQKSRIKRAIDLNQPFTWFPTVQLVANIALNTLYLEYRPHAKQGKAGYDRDIARALGGFGPGTDFDLSEAVERSPRHVDFTFDRLRTILHEQSQRLARRLDVHNRMVKLARNIASRGEDPDFAVPEVIRQNQTRMVREASAAFFETLNIIRRSPFKDRNHIVVRIPAREYITLAGYPVELLGHDPNSPVDKDYVQLLEAALQRFSEKIDTLSDGWLNRWVIPLIVQFPRGAADVESFDTEQLGSAVGGNSDGLLYIGRYPRNRRGRDSLVGVIAHELGHRVFDWLEESLKWLDMYEDLFLYAANEDEIKDGLDIFRANDYLEGFSHRDIWFLSKWDQIWKTIPTTYGQRDKYEAFADAFRLIFMFGIRTLPPEMQNLFRKWFPEIHTNPSEEI